MMILIIKAKMSLAAFAHLKAEVGSMKKVWNAAIYARVSTDKKEQQESIPMQVQSLKNWLDQKIRTDKTYLYNLIEIYEDAGFSGSDFQRDSFIRMRHDIDKGKINMVITRDLSRFSRNYIMAGYYIEDYFRENNVRFISVLDNVDTIKEVDDIVPFKNILNEMYIKDCSKRTRDGLKQRMMRGSSIAGRPPYGYIFRKMYEGNVKTISLVPAEDETSETVKEIYSLYLIGWGFGRIANYLNSKGVSPPSSKIKNFKRAKFGIWTNSTIRCILTNPKYAGIMAQHRFEKVSYKVKKIIKTDKDEWIYGREFKGIITMEIFEEVQKSMKKRAKSCRYKGGDIHPFSTVLRCGSCKGSMSYRKKYEGYKCTRSQIGGGRCTAHSVKEEYLKKIIAENLKEYAEKYIDKEGLYNEAAKIENRSSDCDRKIKNIGNELNKLSFELQKVYEDRFNNILTEKNAENLICSIQKNQENLLSRKEELLNTISAADNKDDIYINEIDEILNFKELDREAVETLIDKIIVEEDKITKQKRIHIYYKFGQAH